MDDFPLADVQSFLECMVDRWVTASGSGQLRPMTDAGAQGVFEWLVSHGFSDAEARCWLRRVRFEILVARRGYDAVVHGIKMLPVRRRWWDGTRWLFLEHVLGLGIGEEPDEPVVRDDDTAPTAMTVVLADTVARHAPPVRAFTRSTREALAA